MIHHPSTANAQVKACASASIQYIGQVGVIIRRNGFHVAIDPYLTDSVDRLTDFPAGYWTRSYAPPVHPSELNDLDLVLLTHEHQDHLDPETLAILADASPNCKFAGPLACQTLLADIGIAPDRLIALKYGTPMQANSELRIHPIAAWHEEREVDAEGWDRYLGYILQWDGLTIYHAGDTLVQEELIEMLHAYRIDIGMLPINGRDLFRNRLGVVGNMNAFEAAAFAAELRMNVVIPLHYDLYPNNSEGIAGFVDALLGKYRGQKFQLFQPGETRFF
ncbi:MBL fold metallo-hydrolase [Paenibacillus sp. CF384]|uniref:MBL fold metallo-hydrolase n=1 Tax=Paenibacillus sp. CF384 TaxID=1884382 RepID=UPI00089875C7|nr:MBL fold metallo-hydrolase [Paenibacillus sp. CF384]SDX51257.1 L-ascorbate metabolism protein UlaG, beta-lactamase superfamily [Paenibacillus sp. CF384]